MTPYALAVTAVVTAVGGPLAALAVAWVVRQRPAAQPESAGVMPTGFRYCPTEHRTRAAIEHPDGSARCSDCGTHIPPAGA
jgi:hypothetical protein